VESKVMSRPKSRLWTASISALTFITILLLSGGAFTGSQVELTVHKRTLPAPADVMVTVRVPADADNRSLTIQADSGEYLRSSTIELDGEYEAYAHQFWLKNLPEGEYVLTAQVRGTNGVRAKAALTLSVVGVKTRK
jgi:hypothetical protein